MITDVQTEGNVTTLRITGNYIVTTFNIRIADQGLHITGTWHSTLHPEEQAGDLAIFPVSPHELCVEMG